MMIWFTVLLYPAILLMLATLLRRRVSFLIMLWTQLLVLLIPFIRFLLGLEPFAGFSNSILMLVFWLFAGLLTGWPLAERLRRYIDQRRETITSTIILPQAFRSALLATIITTLQSLCWQKLTLVWPLYQKPIGDWLGVLPTLIILGLCLLVGLIGLPRYINSVFYRR
ncbi:hypothetical protein [Aquirhabdus parva]|uniref:Uncharacterized protein n=1 Tax=Aquirhabdus parva TaxID=2283318 RepID=A0A345P2Q2_9GAMM|nr:hypothetical protein [Aquirhabdus parva]AXI01561.1 hypothetical protein HYN46_00795 [Aquirhabdus parva]